MAARVDAIVQNMLRGMVHLRAARRKRGWLTWRMRSMRYEAVVDQVGRVPIGVVEVRTLGSGSGWRPMEVF